MAQKQWRRTSDSPYLDTIWRSEAISDGAYLATPDGSWDLITAVEADGSRVTFITGQATKAQRLHYKAGQRSVVISFAAGAYLVPFRGAPFAGDYIMLTMPDSSHFELAGHVFPLPTFENAEELIGQLVEQGVLASDTVVDGMMRGTPKAASKRSVERHFKTTTGLSPKQLADIRRAQAAVRMLKAGKDPATVAAEVGYYDQPHMSKAIKRLMGSLPSNVDDVNQV